MIDAPPPLVPRPHPVSALTSYYRHEAGELAIMNQTVASLKRAWGTPAGLLEHHQAKARTQLERVHAAHHAVVEALGDGELEEPACSS
jgi:hypothetical protein